MSDRATDTRYMNYALALGRRGLGSTWPNPSVGCVLVREGRVIGRGSTGVGGAPHAETVALAMAGPTASGATAYVTLEPCAHSGKTAPCCEALIAAGVARVVVALTDPDPRVNGKGISSLQNAGIKADINVCRDQAAQDNAGFLSRVERGRPTVTLKLAATLDGRIATASGESRWITGPRARQMVHLSRATHDAVLIGAGTARQDDPELTVRTFKPKTQPVRVVASRNLDIALNSKLAATAGNPPVWLMHGPGVDTSAWKGLGAVCISVAIGGDRQLGALDMLLALGERGLTRVYCEGGGALAATLLGAGLVDELHVYHAGKMIGAEGTPGVGAMGIDRLAEAPNYQLAEARSIGDDALSIWRAVPD